MHIETHAGIPELRAALRDLVAISTIPAAWVGREPPAIAAGLADVLLGSLGLDFAFVRLCDPNGGSEVEATRGNGWSGFPKWLSDHFVQGAFSCKEIVPDIGRGARPCRGVVIPIGVNAEAGLAAAACGRADFPNEIDQLLLSVAANHAAAAFQNARLCNELDAKAAELRQARDNLEMKVAERTADLRQSEAYLAEAQRVSHTGSFGWSVSSRQIYWSDETVRILEWDQAHKPTVEFVLQRTHPEDRAFVKETLDDVARDRKAFDFEHRLLMPDGSVKFVRVVGHPSTDVESGSFDFVGAVTDITQSKRAEESLRWSEKELREVIETIPAMAFTRLPDGSGTFVNRRWTEYSGLSLEQTLGLHWQATIHPEDTDTHLNKWRASLSSGQPFENEARHRSANGEYRWFLVRAVPLRDEHGNVLKWYGILTDIEDRKRAEAFLTGEKRILEMVAKGDSLPQILDSLCLFVEEQASGVLASILLLDGNRLRHGGAPSLPKAYTDAIDGAVIGPSAGSCGTAAYRGEQAIVEDIATDPLWTDYRDLALPHSLRACWSTPVFSSQGKVMATFAMYYREPRSPSPRDQETIEQITYLAGVAIERKLTQDALRRGEAYLAEAQRLTHTGSWAYKAGGREGYWSEETFRIFQYDRTTTPTVELILQRVHREDAAFVRQTIERASQDGKDFDFEHRLRMPDGSVKYLRVVGRPSVGRPSKDESGSLELVGAVVDVSDRKRAEERLRRSEADLLEAQRLSQTGSWKLDVSSGTVTVSPQVLRIFGVKPDEETSTPEFWLSRNHPEDQKRIRELFERSTIQKTDYDAEYRIVVPDGAIKHLHAVGHPVLNESGDLVEFVGTVMDVTEQVQTRAALEKALQEIKQRNEALRRSEATLAEAQRMTHTGSWVWNVRTDALFWSQEVFRIYGYDLEMTPTWDFLFERVHPEDRPEIEGRKKMESTQKEWTDSESDFRIVLSDGTIKHLHTIAHPVMDKSGEITEVVGTVMDVTERKRAEEERERLRQLEADLAHVNRVSVLGELAASLSHELKQPIAAAITNAGTCLRWLKRDQPDIERASNAATRIVGDGKRAAEIINRLRSFYKQGAPAERELVDVNEVIREMLVLLRSEANRYSIPMRTDLAADLPSVSADRVPLQQVFLNLMLNAIEAMKDSGGQLTIKSQLGNDGQLLISMSDNGVGLPSEKADQIFNAFFTTKPQGSGMGLAISRSIVESHGGRLWATANSGGGATFHFTLPTAAEVVKECATGT